MGWLVSSWLFRRLVLLIPKNGGEVLQLYDPIYKTNIYVFNAVLHNYYHTHTFTNNTILSLYLSSKLFDENFNIVYMHKRIVIMHFLDVVASLYPLPCVSHIQSEALQVFLALSY